MAARTLTPTRFLLHSCLTMALLVLNAPVLAEENAVSEKPAASAKKSDDTRLPLEDVQRFSTAISQIKSYYVKDVNDQKLFEDAIRGMLNGLDPHSSYLDADEFKELTESTRGEFGGLGIEVTMENGVIKVISPIDDTPAAKAGIKAGDYIIRIDDKPIKDMTLRDAVNLMRGKKGSPIKLIVVRKTETKPITFNILRDVIHVQSVKSRLLPDNYGYIRVSHFQAPTVTDMNRQLAELQKKAGGKLNGLILDLRNNPGGLLDSAIEMSDAFIDTTGKTPTELIVQTKGRIPGSVFSASAKPGDLLSGAPMVVMINGGSASASEIVAGALKDNHRAMIVGTKSFGKGSVQTVLPLDQKRGIKLTTALYYTPSGRSIQAEGIKPDVVIEEMKIPKDVAVKKDVMDLTEADLQDHLQNGNATPETTTATPKDQENKQAVKPAPTTPQASNDDDLLHNDFQLYQAFNLLKSMKFSHKQ